MTAAVVSSPPASAEAGRTRCLVFSRIVGYIRPLYRWNDSKSCEYSQRKVFSEKVAEKSGQELPF